MDPILTRYRLAVFLEAVSSRSLTAAARRLHVTQPAVSAQIRELETQIGTPLFRRGGRALVLAPAGEILAGYGRQLLDLEQEALAAVGGLITLQTGRLTVGASETPGHYLLLRTLGDFRRAHPGIVLAVSIANSPTVTQRVEDGSLELGFVEGGPLSEKLVRRPIAHDALRLVVPRRDPLAKRRSVTLKDLVRRDFVMRDPGSAVRTQIDAAFGHAGFTPRIAMEFGSTEAVKHAVEAGLGIAFVPAVSFAADRQRLASPAVRGLDLRRTVWLLHSKTRTLSPAATVFVDLLARRRN